MNEIYEALLERNARETTPFVAIHQANATLWKQVDALQAKCDWAEREISSLRLRVQDAGNESSSSVQNSAAAQAAIIKNEAKLRDKLEKLQEELNAKLKAESEDRAAALKTSTQLSELKDVNTAQEKTIAHLKKENERAEKTIEHLTKEVEENKSRTNLAEKQYDGLKATIRELQEENDLLKKENRQLEERIVTDKEKMVHEMNSLTETVEKLKNETDMLRTLKEQEEKRRKWFGSGKVKDVKEETVETKESGTRKFGEHGVILPTEPKYTIQAHSVEGLCVRYDDAGSDLMATSGSDSMVKVWDASTGSLRATLRGSHGHAVIGCDISGSLAVGAGSDKTCRVWNVRTERMIHHLVGHQHKITCVRLFGGEKAVITGSADRSLKVWDISHRTYRQTTTLRHSSTSNCVDVGPDSFTAVSGHMDGGLRFWDLRTGERTGDIAGLHDSGITSVQFDPMDSTRVLTNSLDSTLKIVDARNCMAVCTLRHAEFSTAHSWSRGVMSPDGRYVAAGSGSPSGNAFVWDAVDGSLKKKLSGAHKTGIVGIDWSRGGNSGQQVATLDRKGVLVLWA